MEATALRIRVRETADRDFARRTDRIFLRRLILGGVAASSLSILAPLRADIPWPEVVHRLAQENEKLARRPQGQTANTLLSVRFTTRQWNPVSLSSAVLTRHR
jgi:hypothetical protein